MAPARAKNSSRTPQNIRRAASNERGPASFGYRLPGYRDGYRAVYIPAYNQVWTSPDFPRREVDQGLLEEAFHIAVISHRPAQLYPLYNQLIDGSVYPRLEVFSDLVEALFVAGYPLGRGRPISLRNLPRVPDPYDKLGRKIISMAIEIAKSADRYLIPSTAREKALLALLAFLFYVLPNETGQSDAILNRISAFGAPAGWKHADEVFERLIRKSDEAIRHREREIPFSLARPAEPHNNIVEMLRLLSLIITNPASHLVPVIPGALEYLSLGLASFLPLIWLRGRTSRVYAAIQMWDITSGALGGRRLSNSNDSIPYQKTIPGCRAQQFYRDCFKLIFKIDSRCEIPLGRLRLFELLMEQIPDLIRKNLYLSEQETARCPHCRIALQDERIIWTALACLKLLPKRIKDLTKAVRSYPAWLFNDCMRVIEEKWLERKSTIEVASLSRPTIVFKVSQT